MSNLRRALSLTLVLFPILLAAAEPQQVLTWPEGTSPVLRFTFGKFRDMGGTVGSQRPFSTEVLAENLSTKPIAQKRFNVYFFDKKQIRIGEAWMEVTDLTLGQPTRFQVSSMMSGTPVSVTIAPVDMHVGITLTVNSNPQGASLKLDGAEQGTTPKLIEVTPGKHILSFSKEGFRAGTFPLEIGPRDVSGGSISYELGSVAYDTIELRDGTILNGDLDSIAGMDVVVRVGGSLERIDRNKVKRILLVQREAPEASSLPQPSQETK